MLYIAPNCIAETLPIHVVLGAIVDHLHVGSKAIFFSLSRKNSPRTQMTHMCSKNPSDRALRRISCEPWKHALDAGTVARDPATPNQDAKHARIRQSLLDLQKNWIRSCTGVLAATSTPVV